MRNPLEELYCFFNQILVVPEHEEAEKGSNYGADQSACSLHRFFTVQVLGVAETAGQDAFKTLKDKHTNGLELKLITEQSENELEPVEYQL